MANGMAQLGDVLIVEKDPVIREYFGDLFLAAGYGRLVAADGREAVEAFRARRPHLVVTDLHLPGMSGIEVFQEVRREDPDVAVIVVCGGPSFREAHAALKLGAYYLMKPIEAEELLFTAERALERRQLLIERRWCQEHHGGTSGPAHLSVPVSPERGT